MTQTLLRSTAGRLGTFSGAALLLAGVLAPAVAAGPFASFAGRWTGGGDVAMTDGSSERLRCKADYAPSAGGDALAINVNCASDSYRVNIVSQVAVSGGRLSGHWQETTRGVEGNVNGRVPSPGVFQANLDGVGFNIGLSATSDGRRQAVTITTGGTDVQGANIQLRRG